MNVFDEVIAGLAERGAFRAVPKHPEKPTNDDLDLTRPGENPTVSLKHLVNYHRSVISQLSFDYQFRSVHIALNAYAPPKLFASWYRRYAQRTTQRRLDLATRAFIGKRLVDLNHTIKYLTEEQIPTRLIKHDQAEELASTKILRDVLAHHPSFLITMAIFQKANLDYMYRLALRIRNTHMLDAAQRQHAAVAIKNITSNFGEDNFLLGPGDAIAFAYHTRVGGDYTKPMAAEDFTKAWETAVKGDVFKTHLTNSDGSQVVSRCPFQPHATRQAAVDVGAEICQHATQEKGLHASMGYGLWCLYSALQSSRLRPVHRMQVAIISFKANSAFGRTWFQKNPFRKPRLVANIQGVCNTIGEEAETTGTPGMLRRMVRNPKALLYSVQSRLAGYTR